MTAPVQYKPGAGPREYEVWQNGTRIGEVRYVAHLRQWVATAPGVVAAHALRSDAAQAIAQQGAA